MTLQELLKNIPAAEKVKRVPSVAKLAKEAIPVVMDAMDADTSVTVYSNGYVLYQKDQWATVFPLHDCTDYIYKDSNVESFVPFAEFMNQPWQVRVLMEGYDRMDHNYERRKEGRAVSIDIDNNEEGYIELSDMGAGDALRIIVERESKKEEKELLRKNLECLTNIGTWYHKDFINICAGVLINSSSRSKRIRITSILLDCLDFNWTNHLHHL